MNCSKPCVKSLKPNELHNYIYQSGPEEEAWKLQIGIVRVTISGFAPPFVRSGSTFSERIES